MSGHVAAEEVGQLATVPAADASEPPTAAAESAPDNSANSTTPRGSEPGDPVKPTATPGRWRTIGRRWPITLIAVITVALAITMLWSIVQYRDDAALATANREAGPAAADAATAILSYKPATVTADLARARSHLSGDFATYFDKLGTDVVLPAATQRHMSSTATVTATSVVSANSNAAVALVFVNQVTTADDLKQPTTISSSLRLELHKIDGHWLVTKLDTV
ncbi:hypothetical protein [Nocardia alni]|uniref:hypothetical protein n=1 Tax=Nocardia alni TaxID=2815723 RepID=UPI001C22F9B8|nr:hypothetical protein [Nocardia alni]